MKANMVKNMWRRLKKEISLLSIDIHRDAQSILEYVSVKHAPAAVCTL